MAVSYIITVLDDDHLEVLKEEDIIKYNPGMSEAMLAMINSVLDARSAEEENDG